MSSFSSLRTRSPDYLLFGIAMILAGIGLVIIYSASSIVAMEQYRDAAYFLKRQALWLLVSVAACLLAMRVPYTLLRRLTLPLLVLSVAGLLLVFAPGIGHTAGGASRWIGWGPVRFQPVELAKLALLLYLAGFLAERGQEVQSFTRGVLPPLLVFGAMAVPVVAQPNLGSTAVMALVTGLMLCLGGARLLHLGVLGTGALALSFLLILQREYSRRRLLAFLDPGADPRGAGYQIIQSLLGFGSGGILGLGLGESRQKFFYLPERHTDFIFSILGEELGLVGAGAVLILFLGFVYRGFRIARLAPNRYASLLAGGITLTIGIQALLNIGVVTGVLPITGVPLPFLSYGGSSLLMAMIAVGILMNISQYIRPAPPLWKGRGRLEESSSSQVSGLGGQRKRKSRRARGTHERQRGKEVYTRR
ncbi:MAG: putative lipid II flippase FtsW [Armatimonadota bacterium]|nr:putative lipid II flippase FtsW [Armatimonadota bacterium]